MAAEDLESLEATVELLSDAAATARLAEADAQLAAGRRVTQEEMSLPMEQRLRKTLAGPAG